jgi:uncharacterized membrane protein (DUF2068 family)
MYDAQHAPTLNLVIFIKVLKAALLLLVAAHVQSAFGHDFPAFLKAVMEYLHQESEGEFFTSTFTKIRAHMPPGLLYRLSSGMLFYALLSLLEAVGLYFRLTWAGWLTIAESVIFIALQGWALTKQQSHVMSIFLVLNAFVGAYLFVNRGRLFTR